MDSHLPTPPHSYASPVPPLNEYSFVERLTPQEADEALSKGWRHFGEYFFRYSEMTTEQGHKLTIQPLRLTVAKFEQTKSQRRIVKRNNDISLRIAPSRISSELQDMFDQHKSRFTCNVPGRLADFLGEQPGVVVPNLSFLVYAQNRLIAVSFLDVGRNSVSSVYAMFDPAESKRGLGHFTMLAEISWCMQNNYTYYYPGYGSVEPSVYDYKKNLNPLDRYDWVTDLWVPLER